MEIKLWKLNFKSLLLSTIILLTMFSCSDSDDGTGINNQPLLPKVITTIGTSNFEYDYTSVETFTYDNLNRPTEIINEILQKVIGETEYTFSNKVTTKLEYLSDNTILQTDITKNNEQTSVTTIRKYVPTNKSTIQIMQNDEVVETIELNGELAVKHNSIDFTETLQYNDNNEISQYSYSKGTYSFVEKYEYDKKEGIYKNISIPQWLFVSLFKTKGNANNIAKIYLLQNDEFISIATYDNEYNNAGYPIKMKFVPDLSRDGISESNTMIEYMEALN